MSNNKKFFAKLATVVLIAASVVTVSPVGPANATTTAATVYVPCDPADNHPAFVGANKDIYVTPGEVITFVSSGFVNCSEFAYWYPDNPALPVFTNPVSTNNPASTKTYHFPANGQFTVNTDVNTIGQTTTMYVVENDGGFDGFGPFWGQRFNIHVIADDCPNLGVNVKTDIDGKCVVTLGTGTSYFTVPNGVTEIFATGFGGSGGDNSESYGAGLTQLGGRAARVTGSITAAPGDVIQADNQAAGGVSWSCTNWAPGGVGGWGGAGGGLAKVTINSAPTAVLAVGGGGGAGCSTNFATELYGGGGGDAGLTGATASAGRVGQWDAVNDSATGPGQGGTQSAGGASVESAGSQWAGGNAVNASASGGGGGSGYFGGGAGEHGFKLRSASGGGGGSSFISGFTLVSEELVRTGTTNAAVQISFVAPPPATAPGAPTIGTPSATGTTTANVPFTAPASDGGDVIGYYILDSSPAANADLLFQAGSGTIAATGLTANTDYTFRVAAHNNVNYGPYSSSSATTTTWPNAPTLSAATAASGSLSLPFTPGAAGGGATIIGYNYSIVATAPAGGTLTGSCGTTSPCVISGLTNGTTYSVTITAQNNGGSSAASNAITGTPAAPGGGGGGGGASAPTITRVKSDRDETKVYFTPGTQFGITGYRYSVNGGEWQRASRTTSPINIKVKLKRYALRIRSVSGNVLGDISAVFNVRDN